MVLWDSSVLEKIEHLLRGTYLAAWLEHKRMLWDSGVLDKITNLLWRTYFMA